MLEVVKAAQAALNKEHHSLYVRVHDDLQMGIVFLDDLDTNAVVYISASLLSFRRARERRHWRRTSNAGFK